MSKAIRFLVALAFVACTSASTASAALVTFTADLKGENEVPPVTTDASGFALLVLNTDTNDFDFELTVLAQGIDLDDLRGAHIHVGLTPPGAPFEERTGPFFIDLIYTSFNQIGGVLFRQFEGSFPATHQVAPGLNLRDELFKGNTYVNLHTVAHGGGEIRGQLVPEPATLALLGVGVVVAVARRRRR